MSFPYLGLLIGGLVIWHENNPLSHFGVTDCAASLSSSFGKWANGEDAAFPSKEQIQPLSPWLLLAFPFLITWVSGSSYQGEQAGGGEGLNYTWWRQMRAHHLCTTVMWHWYFVSCAGADASLSFAAQRSPFLPAFLRSTLPLCGQDTKIRKAVALQNRRRSVSEETWAVPLTKESPEPSAFAILILCFWTLCSSCKSRFSLNPMSVGYKTCQLSFEGFL